MSTELDLEKLAQEIGQRGTERDTAIALLVKGIAAGLEDVRALAGFTRASITSAALVKGDDDMGAKDDTTSEEDPETEESEDNGGEGMAKGDPAPNAGEGPGPLGASVNGATVDATDLVKGLQGQIEAFQIEQAELKKAVSDQSALIKGQATANERLLGQIETLTNVIVTLTEKTAASLTDLTKGVAEGWADARARVLQAPGVDPNIANQLPRFAKADPAPGEVFEVKALVKGMQHNILSNSEVELYKRTGLFSNDTAIHATRVTAMRKLAATTSTPT